MTAKVSGRPLAADPLDRSVRALFQLGENMETEEIEIVARCAGLMKYLTPPGTREWHGTIDDLSKLVNGVIRNEREACAKVAESWATEETQTTCANIAEAIRRSNA